MNLTLQCSSCQAKLKVDEKFIGQQAKCPKCQAMINAVPPPTVAAEPKSSLSLAPSASPSPQPNSKALIGILLIIGVLVVGGGSLAIGGIGMALFLRMNSGEGAIATPITEQGPVLSSETSPSLTPVEDEQSTIAQELLAENPIDAPSKATSSETGAIEAPSASDKIDTTSWESLPDNPVGIRLKFPAAAAPFDVLENLTGVERELGATAFANNPPTALRATADGKTFSFTLMSLPIVDVIPIEVYLMNAGQALPLAHPGFELVEEYRQISEPLRAADWVLRSDTATRVARIAHDGERSMSLVVEGPREMTYEDPWVQAFLVSFKINDTAIGEMELAGGNRVADVPTFTPIPVGVFENPLLLPQTVSELTNHWQWVQGEQIDAQVWLPSGNAQRCELDEFFANIESINGIVPLQFMKENLAAIPLDRAEVIYLNQGSRRFIVVLFAIKKSDDFLWYEYGSSLNVATTSAGQFFTEPNASWRSLETVLEPKGTHYSTTLQLTDTHGTELTETRLIQTRHAGQYGALLVFESQDSIEWPTAEEAKFFSQFEYPADTLDFSNE